MKRPAFLLSSFISLSAVLTSGCSAHADQNSARPRVAVAIEQADARDDGLVELVVPGYGNAMVSVPRGAIGPKPVMVAAHGRGMGPDICDHFRRELVGDRGFILCPRGKPYPARGFTFDVDISKEIDAGLVALRARFGPLVDPGPMIYVGYSQGAAYGPSVVMKSPARYPRVVMIEGGVAGWDAKAFAKAGGQRMLFACGQAPLCEERDDERRRVLTRGRRERSRLRAGRRPRLLREGRRRHQGALALARRRRSALGMSRPIERARRSGCTS